MSELNHTDISNPPELRPVTFHGRVNLVELVGVTHTVLPQDSSRIFGILQHHMGSKGLRLLKPLISEPDVEMTRDQVAERAEVIGQTDRRFKQTRSTLDQTPYTRWLVTKNMQPEPNLYRWAVPPAVAATEPISQQVVSEIVGEHLHDNGQFPVLPYDPHHRGAIRASIGKETSDRSPLIELRIAGIAMTYGLDK